MDYTERGQRGNSAVYSSDPNGREDITKKADQVVLVIDDDPSVRTAITSLIEAVGLRCQTFASGHEFLEAELPDVPRCLVLDVRLPGLSGLNLQRELSQKKHPNPNYLRHGPWRYTDDRTGHEGWSDRVSHQAV